MKRSLFIPQIRKNEAEWTLFIPINGKIEAKQSLFIPQIRKIEAERTLLLPEIGKIQAKKTNWIKVKGTEAVFLKLLWSPGIDSKDLIPPASALAGLYNNPTCCTCSLGYIGWRNRFLGSLNVYKYTQATLDSGIGSLESIPRLYNMKNEDEDKDEDEDNSFGSKRIYRPSTIKGMKNNEFICS